MLEISNFPVYYIIRHIIFFDFLLMKLIYQYLIY